MACHSVGRTHINGELSPHPDKLGRIGRQLLYATDMRLEGIDGVSPQLIDSFQIPHKHIRVLIILGRDILPDRGR